MRNRDASCLDLDDIWQLQGPEDTRHMHPAVQYNRYRLSNSSWFWKSGTEVSAGQLYLTYFSLTYRQPCLPESLHDLSPCFFGPIISYYKDTSQNALALSRPQQANSLITVPFSTYSHILGFWEMRTSHRQASERSVRVYGAGWWSEHNEEWEALAPSLVLGSSTLAVGWQDCFHNDRAGQNANEETHP